MSIKLLLADDQALVRGALAALLDLESDLEVVAEVGRGDEVVAAALEHRPDVALRAPFASVARWSGFDPGAGDAADHPPQGQGRRPDVG